MKRTPSLAATAAALRELLLIDDRGAKRREPVKRLALCVALFGAAILASCAPASAQATADAVVRPDDHGRIAITARFGNDTLDVYTVGVPHRGAPGRDWFMRVYDAGADMNACVQKARRIGIDPSKTQVYALTVGDGSWTDDRGHRHALLKLCVADDASPVSGLLTSDLEQRLK